MARLPPLSTPDFDPSPFKQTGFEVWSQDDPGRTSEPFLSVRANQIRHYADVSQLLRKHSAQFAFLITAWNPLSKPRPLAENEAANEQLLASLKASGLVIYPARGTSLENGCDWFEDSFLIVGGTYEQYVAWQLAFEQLAFVIFRTDGAVELRW